LHFKSSAIARSNYETVETLSAHLLVIFRGPFEMQVPVPIGTIDTPSASYQGSWSLRYGSLKNKIAKFQIDVKLHLRSSGCAETESIQMEESIDSHADCEHSRARNCTLTVATVCWAVMELFANIYLYEFILCLVCVRIRCFGLY